MSNKARYQYIDDLIENTEKNWAWNYFVTQTMQLALNLVGEAIPGSALGLILPLQRKKTSSTLRLPKDLPQVGRSLMGWLTENRSLHVFLVSSPQFSYADDHRIEQLSRKQGTLSKDDPLLVVPRQTDFPGIESCVVEAICTLFDFIYDHQQHWYPGFQDQIHDQFLPVNRTRNGVFFPDTLLNNLMDIIIQFGGPTKDGQNCWRFCCVLRPKEPRLPLQQNLFVYAQSKGAPHKIGTTIVSANKEWLCLSLRAYLSPHIHYIDDVAPKDTTIDFQEAEEPIHSALALPIGSEQGVAYAVLYVASGEIDAFPTASQAILRIMCKMIGNLLTDYRTQQKSSYHLIDAVRHPTTVDPLFESFSSENDFRHSVRTLLEEILENERRERKTSEEVSFIAIGMDNLDRLAPRYGNHILRNLHREMGLRVQHSITWNTQCKLYHVYGDRFYLLFRGSPFNEVRKQAIHLKNLLEEAYRIDAQYTSTDQLIMPGQKLPLENLTIHLAFTSYTMEKLLEILHQHKEDANTVSLKMRSTLEDGLKKGEDEGGNVIVAWSREQGMFLPLTINK